MNILPKILASDYENEIVTFGDNYDIAIATMKDSKFTCTGVFIILNCSTQGIIFSWIKGTFQAVTQEFDYTTAEQTESFIKKLLGL